MSDRDPVCVAHGCMQQRHFVSIRKLQAENERLRDEVSAVMGSVDGSKENIAAWKRLKAALKGEE